MRIQLILMHEGQAAAARDEMTEPSTRMDDGAAVGRERGDQGARTLKPAEACHLRPIADDMACAHPKVPGDEQTSDGGDPEGWLVRAGGPHSQLRGRRRTWSGLCIDPPEPLIF